MVRPPKQAIKPEKKLPLPALSFALGMAASYYTYQLFNISWRLYFLAAIFFLFIAVISFLRVIRYVAGKKAADFHKLAILAAALAAGFSFGIASRQSVQGPPEMGLPAERVTAVSGILREDPRSLSGGSGYGILELYQCSGQGGQRASARGNLSVFFPAESIPYLREFGRGSEIYADGVLSLTDRGLLFNASSVHIVRSAPPIETFRTALRTNLIERFQSRQGQDAVVWGGLASALLLGMRDDLNVDLAEGFRNSGCTHILALSGMHLAIISSVLAFLLKGPLGIRRSSLIGAVFIVVYVFVAGSQPSLVRSAIMYLIGTLSVWGLLKGKAISLLSMAFIIQLIFQSDTGESLSFILSYLALLGILSMGENLHSLLRGRLPEIVNGSFSASIGAFVFTAPVVALFFDTLRPIGILATLVVAPISAVFMVLGLAALFASFLPIPLWNLFDFALTHLYRLLEFTVSAFGTVPGFSAANPLPVLVFSLLFYLSIIYLKRRDNAHRNSIASFS